MCSPFCGCKPGARWWARARNEALISNHVQALLFLRYIHGHGNDDAQEDCEAPEAEEGLLGRSRVLVERREVAVLLLERLGPEPRGNGEAQRRGQQHQEDLRREARMRTSPHTEPTAPFPLPLPDRLSHLGVNTQKRAQNNSHPLQLIVMTTLLGLPQGSREFKRHNRCSRPSNCHSLGTSFFICPEHVKPKTF